MSNLPGREIFGEEAQMIIRWETLAAKAGFRRERLARLVGVSMRTLDRYFLRERAATVREWLNHVRLDHARVLLKSGARVKRTAYETGFKQVSHFSRAFRERFGHAPSATLTAPTADPAMANPPGATLRTVPRILPRMIPPTRREKDTSFQGN